MPSTPSSISYLIHSTCSGRSRARERYLESRIQRHHRNPSRLYPCNHSLNMLTQVIQFYFLGETFYLASLALTRISILCFYLRIFPDKEFRRIVFVVIALCAAYGISFVTATIFQCSPVNYAWHTWDGEHVGSCNNINLQGWLSAILIMVLDIMTIVLPLRQLYRLNMSLKKKIMLIGMFALGFL